MENLPAFPLSDLGHALIKEGKITSKAGFGLTKREYISSNILAGIISNSDSENYNIGNGEKSNTAINKVKLAIILTDELFKQLNTNTGV